MGGARQCLLGSLQRSSFLVHPSGPSPVTDVPLVFVASPVKWPGPGRGELATVPGPASRRHSGTPDTGIWSFLRHMFTSAQVLRAGLFPVGGSWAPGSSLVRTVSLWLRRVGTCGVLHGADLVWLPDRRGSRLLMKFPECIRTQVAGTWEGTKGAPAHARSFPNALVLCAHGIVLFSLSGGLPRSLAAAKP